jgi:hypothetical protein
MTAEHDAADRACPAVGPARYDGLQERAAFHSPGVPREGHVALEFGEEASFTSEERLLNPIEATRSSRSA